jgi:hypothetical protein
MSWGTFVRRNYTKIKDLRMDLKGINTIKPKREESFAHQLIKFLVCHHLFKLGHHFRTEQTIERGICDIIDLDDFVIYEIETNPTTNGIKRKLEELNNPVIKDIIIIDVRRLNVDWKGIMKLRKEVSKYCSFI